MSTATDQNLCDVFTRTTKGKGRPPRDMVCGVCDADYARHYPTGPMLPRRAFPQIPETCEHFVKLDGKRGKPAPASPCAVCGTPWRSHYSSVNPERGEPQPVKNADRIRPEHIPLGPKQGAPFNTPQGEGKVKGGALSKQGTEKPPIIEAPAPEPEPEPVIEDEPDEQPEQENEPNTPWPVVSSKPRKSAARALLGDDSGEPSITELDRLEARERKALIQSYMKQGMSKEQAEAKVTESEDW